MAFKDIDESFYDGKTPLYDCKMPISENEDGALYSDIIHREYFCKKDDMFNGGDNTQYLTPDQIIQRREEIETSQKIRKEERDIKSTSKTKKEDIRTYLFKEYVIKGSTFYTYVEDINNDMTQLEKGLFILALENTITKKIGSHKSKGFGVMKYDILFDDGSKLSTEVDEITYKATLFKDYSKEIEETIGKAKQWLEDLSEENIRISDVLISKK
jgi:CRISPR type IV-associated protein Csf2